MNFTKSLKIAMAQKGIKSKDLAVEVNVSIQSVASWRRGVHMPKLNQVPQICKALDIKVSEFFSLGEGK